MMEAMQDASRANPPHSPNTHYLGAQGSRLGLVEAPFQMDFYYRVFETLPEA